MPPQRASEPPSVVMAPLLMRLMARKMVDAGVMATAISVDGFDVTTHDLFRGVGGAFEQILKGTEACRNAGLPFQLNMVIRKDNQSQLEDRLKGECGVCKYKLTCSGCRGRAYKETSDMMATDPGC
jgi:radical SAM protein with 4Fe4S-binding SPASM domain